MCGICGMVDLRGHGRASLDTVRGMCDRIRHRGPDGDGFYSAPDAALGMRRLSIIDVDGSDQPLYNEDRSIALVFNGEIYNYRELRADLLGRGHRFHTDGDGETLIHLYEEHGLDLFRHLRGMYGFALWDSRQGRLVLAVDHIGMKPLYLAERDGLLWFGSEVKALFAENRLAPALHLDTLDTYLSFGYMIGAETLFEGVSRLPPGHALIAEGGVTRLVEYWRFPGFLSTTEHTRDAVEHIREGTDSANTTSETTPNDEAVILEARARLTEAVHLHLRADVPLGLFLSGGVDSAAVLALMAREAEGRIKTYTVGYDADTPDNELLHARRIAGHFATEHHERVITADDWWRGFERYAYHHDEPNANPSAVSLQLLSEMTARHVKVVLTGLGGDELFGGYLHHRRIPALLARQARLGHDGGGAGGALLGALERFYPAFKRYRFVGALPTYMPPLRHAFFARDEALLRSHSFDGMVFSDSLRERLYGAELRAAWTRARHKERAYAEIIARSWRDDPYNTAQALVINTWLTGNGLLSQDKTAMAHSLEARVPFFDPALLAFAARVPPALRMQANKYVLREAVRPYLPVYALERPKQPFGTPILHWFSGALAGRIQEVLLDSGAHTRGLFDSDALERLLRAHFGGRESHVEVIFRLLTLELWARKFDIRLTSGAQAAAVV